MNFSESCFALFLLFSAVFGENVEKSCEVSNKSLYLDDRWQSSLASCSLREKHEGGSESSREGERFTFWPIVLRMWNKNDNLRTMKRVLERLGYEEVDGMESQWNIMWALEYPYDRFPEVMKKQRFTSKQKLNHIPGIAALTNKQFMSTTVASKYILPSFRFPDQQQNFEDFSGKNPAAKFVIKNFDNRGVHVVSKQTILDAMTDSFNQKNRFVQVFMGNPFLIAGHAFDMGVYVLITSIEPLTIYRFKSECLFRFCPAPYHPFDPENTRKYVVGEEKLHTWDIPMFGDLIGNFTHKIIVESYFRSHGLSVRNVWQQVDEAIVTTVLKLHEVIVRGFERQCALYNLTNEHFFELLRFDFVIDEGGRVYLMEANLSPNLTPSSEEYERNGEQYEQVVFNALRLIGAEGFSVFKDEVSNSAMTSRRENLAADVENCQKCTSGCSKADCSLCPACITTDFIKILHKTHREHQRRGEFKRIFPTVGFESHNETHGLMTEKTKMLSQWFSKKCAQDDDWC